MGYPEIETELRKLEREEAKLIGDMKKAAKENNGATAKVLAKNLVRLRKNKTRMQESVAQLTGVNAGMKTQQVGSMLFVYGAGVLYHFGLLPFCQPVGWGWKRVHVLFCVCWACSFFSLGFYLRLWGGMYASMCRPAPPQFATMT